MTWLDPTTTSLITALVVTIGCAVYLVDTLSYAQTIAAQLWGVAFSAGVLTAVAYMVWAYLPGAWMAVATGNASFVASIGLLWMGCRRFNGPYQRWAALTLGVAVGATFLAAAVAGPDGGDWAGAGVMIGSIAVLAGLGAVETRRGELLRLRSAVAMTVVLGAVCVYYAARTLVFAIAGPESVLFADWFGTPSTSLVTIALTIVAVPTMVVLRLHAREAAGARGAATLTLDGQGFLDRGSFLRLLDAMLVRGGTLKVPTAVVVLEIDDLPRIAAAFGTRASARISARMRACVNEHSPVTTALGWDEGRALLCLPGSSDQDALRTARRVAQATWDGLLSLDGPVVPVLGIGVVTSDVGSEHGSRALLAAAGEAARTSVARADAAVVVADLAGREPVTDAADRLDPPG